MTAGTDISFLLWFVQPLKPAMPFGDYLAVARENHPMETDDRLEMSYRAPYYLNGTFSDFDTDKFVNRGRRGRGQQRTPRPPAQTHKPMK